jgi:hypothetical protein
MKLNSNGVALQHGVARLCVVVATTLCFLFVSCSETETTSGGLRHHGRNRNKLLSGVAELRAHSDEVIAGNLQPHGRQHVEAESRQLFQDEMDEMVDVIIGFKEETHQFSKNQSPAYSQLAWPQPPRIKLKFSRINAEVVRVPRKDIPLITSDKNVAFAEEDRKRFRRMSETIPWGIPVIQANGTAVPLPDIPSFQLDEKCFRICIVDSGFYLGHPDLVRKRALFCAFAFCLVNSH